MIPPFSKTRFISSLRRVYVLPRVFSLVRARNRLQTFLGGITGHFPKQLPTRFSIAIDFLFTMPHCHLFSICHQVPLLPKQPRQIFSFYIFFLYCPLFLSFVLWPLALPFSGFKKTQPVIWVIVCTITELTWKIKNFIKFF